MLALCVLLSAMTLMAKTDTLDNNKKDTNKELIIVSIDQDFYTQLNALATYVIGKYQATEGSVITIKTYMSGEDESIQSLVKLLEEQGISREDIAITDGEIRLDNPYFTMTVAPQAEVQ